MKSRRVYLILFGCSLLFVLSSGRRTRGIIDAFCKSPLGELFDCHEEEYQEKDCSDSWDCFDICPTGRYGISCHEDCPRGCKDRCDRMTGFCESCKVGKHGYLCEKDCSSSCMGPCDSISGRCLGCPPGKTGRLCNDDCSMNCLGGTCHQVTRICDGCIAGKSGNFCEIAENGINPSTENHAAAASNPWPIIVGIVATFLILAGVVLWCRLSVKREQKNRQAALSPASGQELSSSTPANSPKPSCPPPPPKPTLASGSTKISGKPAPLLLPPQRKPKSSKPKNQAETSTYSHLPPYSELDLRNTYVDVNTRSNCYADVVGRRPSSSYAEMEDRRPSSSYAEMEDRRRSSGYTGVYECVDELAVYQPIECKDNGLSMDPSRRNGPGSIRSTQNAYTLATDIKP